MIQDYDQFVGEFWVYDPSEHGGMPVLGYVALAVAGEGGEVAEKVKNAYRDNDGFTDVEAIKKELGDLLYYLTKMAHLHGLRLIDVAAGNMEKLRSRQARGKLGGEGDDR